MGALLTPYGALLDQLYHTVQYIHMDRGQSFRCPCTFSFIPRSLHYLKFDAQMSPIRVEDISWMRTSRKKLPPVRAHPVYPSLSRPSPPGAPLRSAALTGRGAWSPARTGRGRGRGAAADG